MDHGGYYHYIAAIKIDQEQTKTYDDSVGAILFITPTIFLWASFFIFVRGASLHAPTWFCCKHTKCQMVIRG